VEGQGTGQFLGIPNAQCRSVHSVFQPQSRDNSQSYGELSTTVTCTFAPPQLAIASLTELKACTEDEVQRVMLSSPTKSCTLDSIPTFLLKELVDVLLPYLTAMINASLSEGHLPVSQKHAILTLLLKKSYLSASDLKNYRPVSNLAFVSKVAERIVVEKLISHLQEQDLLP